jgi:hypothetical protein
VGGDLHLLPPILRKYWDGFLQPGPWRSWYEAAAWHKGLSPEQRRDVRQYLGFEHLDLERYDSLEAADVASVPDVFIDTVRREERQRLVDFAVQFDRIVGSPEYGGNVGFWRSYLRDMLALHASQPLLPRELTAPRAAEIDRALGFLSSLEGGDHSSAVQTALNEIDAGPFLLHFLPAMADETLVAMFRTGALPQAGGALELASFLAEQDPEDREAPGLFFELLGGADDALTGQLMAALDDATIRRLLGLVPATVRTRLDTAKLLEVLAVTPRSSAVEVAEGMNAFLTHISGNFRIDRPQLQVLFDVIVVRAEADPAGTLALVGVPRFPWGGFMSLHSDTAVGLLSSDLGATADVVRRSDKLTFPPARFIYRLITVDPELAARVVGRLDDDGDTGLVVEALAHFAYDAHRLAEVPGLPITLEGDGRFLLALLDARGADWLADWLGEAVRTYRDRMKAGEVPSDFLQAYRSTLEIAAAMLDDPASTARLKAVVTEAFVAAGG